MAASRLVEDASLDMAAATEAPAATMAPAATQATGALTDLSPASAEATSRAGDDDSGSGTDSSVTGTNTQEEGVDEPDIIKADGNRIITISENVLTYVDITSGSPVVAGQLTIPEGWGHQLFLNGDRAVLLTNSGAWGGPMPIDAAVPSTIAPVDAEAGFAPESDAGLTGVPMTNLPSATIIEVDLSQPSALRIATTLRIEGQYLNARAIGDRLLLAVSSGPQWMPWLYPQNIAGEEAADRGQPEPDRQLGARRLGPAVRADVERGGGQPATCSIAPSSSTPPTSPDST